MAERTIRTIKHQLLDQRAQRRLWSKEPPKGAFVLLLGQLQTASSRYALFGTLSLLSRLAGSKSVPHLKKDQEILMLREDVKKVTRRVWGTLTTSVTLGT